MRTETRARVYGAVSFAAILGSGFSWNPLGPVPALTLLVIGMVAGVLWMRAERQRKRELTGLGMAELRTLWRAGEAGRAPKDPRLDRAALIWADDQLKRLRNGTWLILVMAVPCGALGYFTGFPRGQGWSSPLYWAGLAIAVLAAEWYQRRKISQMRADVEARASQDRTPLPGR
jgi:hypothetical protein